MVENGDRSPGTYDTYETIYRIRVEPLTGCRIGEGLASFLDEGIVPESHTRPREK